MINNPDQLVAVFHSCSVCKPRQRRRSTDSSISAPGLRMATAEQVAAVGQVLVNPGLDLNRRFRALFTLKNLGGAEAIEWISKAFTDDSALLKHELAYCLGQMQDRRAIPVLTTVLKDTKQEPMVRHEAG
ncbi:hypothetical protein GOODEAATRI_022668 [Goodea atripinnis]|uniref:Deoxyhypusine hydroxylase n=1 Tax=Goodea atripinnis TaxID=208336 RepID=A0ABV0MJY6_9TELE